MDVEALVYQNHISECRTGDYNIGNVFENRPNISRPDLFSEPVLYGFLINLSICVILKAIRKDSNRI